MDCSYGASLKKFLE